MGNSTEQLVSCALGRFPEQLYKLIRDTQNAPPAIGN